METIAHLRRGRRRRALLTAPAVDGDVLDLLEEREVAYTTWDGWLALDAHERELGASHEHSPRARQGRAARRAGRDLARRGPDAVVTYVIALPCVDVKDRACIDECPVDCIYEGERSLYIHPDECVDCGACEPVCPVEAIYYEDDLPDEWQDYYTANVEFFDDIGSPGGAAKIGVIPKDHPVISRSPRRVTRMADTHGVDLDSTEVDVVIVGGGPAGLSAALNLGRARASVVLVDAGRPRNAATLRSHGFLTRDGVSPLELRKLARAELSAYANVRVIDRGVAGGLLRSDSGSGLRFVTTLQGRRPGTPRPWPPARSSSRPGSVRPCLRSRACARSTA